MVLNNAILDPIITANVGAAVAQFLVDPSTFENWQSLADTFARYKDAHARATQDLKDRLQRLHDYEYN